MYRPSRVITIRNEEQEVTIDTAETVVKSLFWAAIVIDVIAFIIMIQQPSISILLHILALILYTTNASFLCFGVWLSRKKKMELAGPTCDCCSAQVPTWANYRRACCGCTCLSRPYVVASIVFAVISLLGIIIDATE